MLIVAAAMDIGIGILLLSQTRLAGSALHAGWPSLAECCRRRYCW